MLKQKFLLALLLLTFVPVLQAQEIRRPTVETLNSNPSPFGPNGPVGSTGCGSFSANTTALPLFYDSGGEPTSSTINYLNPSPIKSIAATYSAFPTASAGYNTLFLKLRYAYNSLPNGLTYYSFDYSLDGGTTWTHWLDDVGAGSENVPPATVSLILPPTQDLTKIRVAYCVAPTSPFGSGQYGSLTGFDIRTEGTIGNPAVQPVQYSPPTGAFNPNVSVTLTTTTPSSTICYTADGSDPTANGAGVCTHGTTYTSPVTVAQTETLKAIGTKSGFTDGVETSSAYTIGAPTFTPPAGTYSSPQSVAVTCPTGTPAGATVYYTTDGSSPTHQGPSGPDGVIVTIASTERLWAFCSATGYPDSTRTQGVYNLSLQVTSTTCPNGQAGTPYSCTLTAAQGVLPYSWQLVTGQLPPGTTIASNQDPAGDGAVKGTPSTPGTYTFTVQVKDSNSPPNLANGTLTIKINNPFANVVTQLASVSPTANPSNSYMQMSLANCGDNVPVVPGTSILVQPVTVLRPNSTGMISGRVLGNDVVSCGGQISTVYTVQFYVNNLPAGPAKQYNVLSNNTFDPTTATAINPGPPPPVSPFGYLFAAPPGSQTLTQKPGTSLTISGQTNLDTMSLKTYTYATLPTNLPAGSYANQSDGDTSNPCGIGGGGTLLLCQWNGTTWNPVQGTGGGGGGGGNTTSTGLVGGNLPVASGPTALANSGIVATDVPKKAGSNTFTGATNDFTSSTVKVPNPVNPTDAANLVTVQAVGQVSNCSSLNSFAVYFATGKVVNCDPNLSETLGGNPVLSFLGQINGFSIATVGNGAGEYNMKCTTLLTALGANYAGFAAPANCPNGLRMILPSDIGTDGQSVIQVSHSGHDAQLGYGTPSAAAGGSPGQIQENIAGNLAGMSYFTANDAASSLTLGDSSHGIFNVWEINSNQGSKSTAGFINRSQGDIDCWRNWNNTGTVDDCIGINSSDRFQWTSPAGTFTFATLADITFSNIGGVAGAGQLPASVVYNNQANTFSTGLQDFSGASLKLPKGAGLTETVNGQVGYDNTANNLHAAINGADQVIPTVAPGIPVNADCPVWIVSGANIKLGDQPCSAGAGNVVQTGSAVLGDVPEYNNGTGTGINDPQLMNLLQGPPNNWQQGAAHVADNLNVRAAAPQTSTGSTKESSLAVRGTDVGSSSSGGGNVGGDLLGLAGDCALTLSSGNSCQGGNLYLAPGGLTGATTASVNNPIPGYGGLFTSWRKGNSGNLTAGNNGRLMCADGTDLQGNTYHNIADICGGVVGDYAAPVGFFVFSNSGQFVNPNGEKLLAQVSGSISGVQTCPLAGGCSGEQWAVNAPVCTDSAHAGYVTSPSSGHCFCPSKRVGTNRLNEGSLLTLHTMEINMGEACESEVKVNGTDITLQSPHNFVSGNGIGVSNSGSNITIAIASPTVANNQGNTYSGGGGSVQDFGSVLLRLPKQNGGTFSVADGAIEYDTSSNHNYHVGGNGVDNILALFPASTPPTNGNCPVWSVVSGVITLGDSGAACGGGGGSGTVNSGTAFQITYYATTGAAVSGHSGLTTNSNGALTKIDNIPTAGNIGVPIPLYVAPVTARNSSLGSTSMVASPINGARYRFGFEGKAVDGGTGCTGTGSVQTNISYTDFDNSLSLNPIVQVIANASTFVSNTFPLPTTVGGVTAVNIAHSVGPFYITVSNAAAITFSTTYTAGAGCSVGQKYAIYPYLEQVN